MNAWQCIETYARLRETRGCAQAISYVGISGERCAVCHIGRQVSIESGDRVRRVCGTCFARLRAELGDERKALDAIRAWQGAQDNTSRGAVTVYPRRGSAENALADQSDRWIKVQPIVETTPPVTSTLVWLQSVETTVMSLRAPPLVVCDRGRRIMPEMQWDPRRVEDHIREALRRIEYRLSNVRLVVRNGVTLPKWRVEEDAMGGAQDWMKVSDAAERLGRSADWVRRNMKTRDARTPGAKRPEYLVRVEDVEAIARERFGDCGKASA